MDRFPESFVKVVGELPAGGRLPQGQEFPFETIRPGRAFMTEVSSRSREPATSSGCASIASRTMVSEPASEARGSSDGIDAGSARNAYAFATSRSGKA